MAEAKSSEISMSLSDEVEPLISALPPDKKLQLRQVIAHQYQGPLPPPAMMIEYDNVIPNGADRLLVLLEKQTDHRILMERTLVQGSLDTTSRGQHYAFGLSIFFGLITAFLGYFGHDVLAGSIGVTTIVGLAIVFVLGKEPGGDDSDDSEKPEKLEQVQPIKNSRKRKN